LARGGRPRGVEERRRHVRGEARLCVRDRVVGARTRADALADRRPWDTREVGVEVAPAGDAVDVLRDGRLRQLVELRPGERERLVDLPVDAKVPAVEVARVRGDIAGV